MNALVAYASSDSEEEEDIRPEKPAKIARIAGEEAADRDSGAVAPVAHEPPRGPQQHPPAPAQHHPEQPPSPASASPPAPTTSAPIGPSIPNPTDPSVPTSALPTTTPVSPSTPPASPYTRTRQQIQTLTLPPQPNFAIPRSPSPPRSPTRAAAHARTTKKFTRFQTLKRGGQHFHARLLGSAALRNPELAATLLRFAGVGGAEQYASTLEVGGVPAVWGPECYVENLVAEAEARRRRAERGKGERVEFVGSGQGRGEGAGEKRRRVD